MTFEEFQKRLEAYDTASAVLNSGKYVIAVCKTCWSRFPVDRVDKMKDFLNMIYWHQKRDNPELPQKEVVNSNQSQLALF